MSSFVKFCLAAGTGAAVVGWLLIAGPIDWKGRSWLLSHAGLSHARETAPALSPAAGEEFALAAYARPSFPGLLDGYAVRPSWSVAGVDYDVGVPSGTTLKDPSTIKMSGVSVNASAHIITVSGSNVTLDGYNFSLGGGWQVNVVNNATNVTIQNSYFKVGS
ncbi:MAG: hypothetical protein J0H38_20600, partial [Rhizobiales bacterium]|nr:hypothetical protein [Hyphomicrobiales bacterium]